MKLDIKRIAKRDTYTIGHLYINGTYFCDTLEDKVRTLRNEGDKVMGETAIPEGEYRVALTYSNRFRKVLPEVLGVPFFKGIRIHSGNTAKDSEGCILVGNNREVGKVLDSRSVMATLMDRLTSTREDIFLSIV